MYCSECGTKNKEIDNFCENCGNQLNEINIDNKVNIKENDSLDFKKIIQKIKFKKENKFKYLILVLLILLFSSYIGLNNMTKPTSVAEGYFKSLTELNVDKVYKYINVPNTPFTTKEQLEDLLQDLVPSNFKVLNYTVNEAKISEDKLNADVMINYIDSNSGQTKSKKINLTRNKNKKWLIFDDWKINSGNYMISNNLEFKVPKGSTLKIDDIEIADEYFNRSENNLDIYEIPVMFNAEYNVKTKLPIGIEIEEQVKIGNYYSYTAKLTEDKITNQIKDELLSVAKKEIQNLYNNAIENKDWESIKSLYENKNIETSQLEKTYENFVESINGNNYKLNKINFTDVKLTNVSLTTENYFRLSLTAKYDFTVSYEKSDEVETVDNSNIDTMYLTFAYVDGEYRLVNASSLNTYFSRIY